MGAEGFAASRAFTRRVTALREEPWLRECVALVRAGVALGVGALDLELEERHAFLEEYAAQEEASWEEAQRRAKEQPQPAPRRPIAEDETD